MTYEHMKDSEIIIETLRDSMVTIEAQEEQIKYQRDKINEMISVIENINSDGKKIAMLYKKISNIAVTDFQINDEAYSRYCNNKNPQGGEREINAFYQGAQWMKSKIKL